MRGEESVLEVGILLAVGIRPAAEDLSMQLAVGTGDRRGCCSILGMPLLMEVWFVASVECTESLYVELGECVVD